MCHGRRAAQQQRALAEIVQQQSRPDDARTRRRAPASGRNVPCPRTAPRRRSRPGTRCRVSPAPAPVRGTAVTGVAWIHRHEHCRGLARSPARPDIRSAQNQSSMTGPNMRRLFRCRAAGWQNRPTMMPASWAAPRAVQPGLQQLQAFDGAEHRDGRRDQRVAVEQRRARARPATQRPRARGRAVPSLLLDQRHQRQDAAFAVVVCAQEQQRRT